MENYSWENVKKILEENLQNNRRKKEQYESQLKTGYPNKGESAEKIFPGRDRFK